jgi:hypothetical protein
LRKILTILRWRGEVIERPIVYINSRADGVAGITRIVPNRSLERRRVKGVVGDVLQN